jgi:cell division protein FtsB
MTQPARSSTKAAIWLAAFILALAAFLVTYVPKLQEAQRLRVEKYKLDEQLREQEAEYNRLVARRQALTNDPREVERVTREKLNMAKPGETVFRFEPESSAPPPRNP